MSEFEKLKCAGICSPEPFLLNQVGLVPGEGSGATELRFGRSLRVFSFKVSPRPSSSFADFLDVDKMCGKFAEFERYMLNVAKNGSTNGR